jgi:hypothetical protein
MSDPEMDDLLQRYCAMQDSIPKDSYEDYILWFCLHNKLTPAHPADLMLHPDFMWREAYQDYCRTFIYILNSIETILAPLSGAPEKVH